MIRALWAGGGFFLLLYFSSSKYNYSLLVMTGTVKFDEMKINITDIVLVRSLMANANDVERY